MQACTIDSEGFSKRLSPLIDQLKITRTGIKKAENSENLYACFMLNHGSFSELFLSKDKGESWNCISQDNIHDLHYVAEDNRIYTSAMFIPQFKNNEHLSIRSSDGGKTWQPLLGHPSGISAFAAHPDGSLFIGTLKGIYKSKEESGCALKATDRPSLKPINKIFQATTEGKLSLGIHVKKGDYVCVTASGEIGIKYNVQQGEVTYEGKLNVSPKGNNSPGLSHLNHLKKFPKYSIGQLVISQGGVQYGCSDFTLKGQNCANIPFQELVMDVGFFTGQYGNYFIAQKDGFIECEINHTDLGKRSGQFDIKIYTVTHNQHYYRNCFNLCPQQEPSLLNEEWIDNHNYQWSESGMGDDQFEECYHGGHVDYRGEDREGCQCVYDKNTHKLINTGNDLGTYDYGYTGKNSGLQLHFILDIFPHILYSKKGIIYSPTPKSNLY